jgi:hypothetical protein
VLAAKSGSEVIDGLRDTNAAAQLRLSSGHHKQDGDAPAEAAR